MEQVIAKTSPSYWAPSASRLPSKRMWSPFDPGFSDILRLLRRHTAPSDKLLEIGCAPGKYLAAASCKLGVSVAGIDYCPAGIRTAERYFRSLAVAADLRCEDLMETSFAAGSFDCVFSMGLIEHFDDPRPIVAKHFDLAKPGGAVVIVIPNFGGVWGRLQARLDPANLAVHNTRIMQPDALRALTPHPAEAAWFGRPSIAVVSAPSAMQHAVAAFSTLVPLPSSRLSPMLALIGERPHETNPRLPEPRRVSL